MSDDTIGIISQQIPDQGSVWLFSIYFFFKFLKTPVSKVAPNVLVVSNLISLK
jgi:hypothetical protein